MQVLWGECISGALYTGDFRAICHQVGFADPRQVSMNEITIQDPELKAITGNARFFSITFRLFKLPGMLEPACEDYGQIAVYKVSYLLLCTLYMLCWPAAAVAESSMPCVVLGFFDMICSGV